jgi:rare lipoprotein A
MTPLRAGKSWPLAVVVKINDRGPHARRRMIDLSYAAAKEIRMVGAGTARVEVAPVSR